ncbi:cytochrome ubiquinol oxidase subunit I [Actinopolymorpha pittospori]
MVALDLARWQFGITTVFHFLFVPLTIGLPFLVAGFQTVWLRTRHDRWLGLTKFFGRLFLLAFAMGVATGIVLEFQFGMNWSAYSRLVGEVFGVPLALEGLLAFFLQSTFLGLWVFGWERLPKYLHLGCMWVVALASAFSAYFVLAANAWMQWPVGYHFDDETGRAELTDLGAVLTNKVLLASFPHVASACFLAAGSLVAAVALWQLCRHPDRDRAAFRSALKVGAVTTVVSGVALAVTGAVSTQTMTDTQPMKTAAAEALYWTARPAGFSLVTFGTLTDANEIASYRIPGVLSLFATGDLGGEVRGIDDLQREYEQRYGPGSYVPAVPVTYWAFRLMIGLGGLAALAAAWALWWMRVDRPAPRPLIWAAIVLPALPALGNSAGWIFTEVGRQPWIVFGLMPTSAGVSPTIGTSTVALSLTLFTLLYAALSIVTVGLLVRYARAGLSPEGPQDEGEDEPEPGLVY